MTGRDVQLGHGHRIVWLSGDGCYALQRTHTCRDGRGRFVRCDDDCPAWDDLRTAPNAVAIVAAAVALGVLQ